MKITTFLLFVLVSFASFAQNKQAQIWYFGKKAGIDFNTNPPTPLLDSEMDVGEGCSTLTDKSGALIAYTDGNFVWNRAHTVMPAGTLHGGNSPFQAAVFIPFPNHPNQYFLFTCMGEAGDAALRYSLLDATLNNGTGDIVTSTKDVVLHSPTSEQMTVISNACENVYWVVALVRKAFPAFDLKIYRVDESGVNPNPTVFSMNLNSSATWLLKFSPNRKHLFWGSLDSDYIFSMADFDSETGRLSNPRAISSNAASNRASWLAFSPDSRYIYSNTNAGIYQYDISIPTSAAILASEVKVAPRGSGFRMQMQLGPDGKIYIEYLRGKYLSVIHNPTQKGLACNFEEKGLDLGGRYTSLGLPTLCPSFLTNWNIETSSTCDLAQSLHLSGIDNFATVDWDFGDGTTTTTTDKQIQHTYTRLGSFTIQATINKNLNPTCTSSEITKELNLVNCNMHIETDNVCLGNISTFSLLRANTIRSVSWNFGDNQTSNLLNPTHTYTSAGEYTVTLEVIFSDNSTQTLTHTLEIYNKPTALTIISN